MDVKLEQQMKELINSSLGSYQHFDTLYHDKEDKYELFFEDIINGGGIRIRVNSTLNWFYFCHKKILERYEIDVIRDTDENPEEWVIKNLKKTLMEFKLGVN